MDTQIKLLNKDYIESQAGQLKEVRQKLLKVKFEETDRAFSRSIYVIFYVRAPKGYWRRGCGLRISDHLLADDPHTTFLIKPNKVLDKKTKKKFIHALEVTATNTLKKIVE